jgi:hypothetical protein
MSVRIVLFELTVLHDPIPVLMDLGPDATGSILGPRFPAKTCYSAIITRQNSINGLLGIVVLS